MTAALIVAAGSGSRMGFDKLLASLRGEPVILHTLRAFQECAAIDGFWIVAGGERGAQMARLAEVAGLTKFRGVVEGGRERHLSVCNGLAALPADTDLVAVHDGARPLIAPELISRCVARANELGAAACARRITETIKRADDDACVTESVSRVGLWAMETPQVFRRDLLVSSYEKVLAEGLVATDEVSVVEHAGHAVWLVENLTPNLKITLPGDLEMAERLLL